MPHEKAARRDLGPLRQERARCNNRSRAHAHVIQQNRSHAHQHPRFDCAAVQNHAVAHGHIVLDDERILVLHHVQNRTILNIASRPDADPVHVAANHRARPDAGVLTNGDVADNYGRGIDVSRRGDLRPPAVIAADHLLAPALFLLYKRISTNADINTPP